MMYIYSCTSQVYTNYYYNFFHMMKPAETLSFANGNGQIIYIFLKGFICMFIPFILLVIF